jgi:hypothetical protein
MENQTTDAILKTPTALAQIGTLAVHYGLSLAGAVVLLVRGVDIVELRQQVGLQGLVPDPRH